MTDVGGGREREVQMAGESLSGSLMDVTLAVISAVAVTLVLLYFLLTSGDVLVRKVAGLAPGAEARHRVVEIARTVEQSVSTYLLTITVINVCLGIAVGTALWLLDMPNPVLWGAMACLLNFVPYVGALVGLAVVALVALLTFDSVGQAAVPPLAYLALTAFEGSFVTPTILGQRLTLSPLVIFVGIIFWGWMWGVVGALLAVPMLASFKIVCDHVEKLKPVGELMGR
jgi:predicted PurR-regulated permease PerM